MLPLLGPGSSAPARARADSAKPTAVRVTGFPSAVDRLTSATIGFNFSKRRNRGIGFRSVDNRDERYAIHVGFVSAFNTGSATITRFAPAAPEPRRRGLSGLAWDSWPPSQCDGLTTRNTGVWSTSLACEPQRRTTLGELR
jgi:hypothetical protein